MRKVIGVLVILGIFGITMQEKIVGFVLQKILEARFGFNFIEELDDGLYLALCGAGGPLPAPSASGPCVTVIAGERVFVVDAGTDGVRNMGRMGIPVGSIESVFLTHFHSDHMDGLGELSTLRWVTLANEEPLPVYGPQGIEKVVEGFNMAYQHDWVYRSEHHGDTVAPLSGAGMSARPFDIPEDGDLRILIDEPDLKIEALRVVHDPVEPAVGYRFTYKERSLLITGDTIATKNIVEMSRGMDLLVHEALAPNIVMMMNKAAQQNGDQILTKITQDILDYHASPIEAAETARDANVGHLLYYHIVPPLIIPGQEAIYLDGAEEIFPEYTLGKDGTFISMPAGSEDINVSQLSL